MAVIDPPENVGDVEHHALVAKFCDATSTLRAVVQAGPAQPNHRKAQLLFLELKQLHRRICLSTAAAKDVTASLRSQIDSQRLQLQNLVYEKSHLQREIRDCKGFRSRDEDIELCSLEEFERCAPEELRTRAHTGHEVMVARLEWEQRDRMSLLAQQRELEQHVEGMRAANLARKNTLDSLPESLTALRTAAEPVSEALHVDLDRRREEREAAHHLPPPLYTIYVNAMAYAKAKGARVTVSIKGDPKEVEAYEHESPEHGTHAPESAKARSRHHRGHAHEAATTSRDTLLKPHPLSVSLAFDLSHVQAVFQYTSRLGLVCARAHGGEDAEDLLTNLFPGDDGDAPPLQISDDHLRLLGETRNSFRVLVVGGAGVGKRSLAAQYALGRLAGEGEAGEVPDEAGAEKQNTFAARVSLNEKDVELELVIVSAEAVTLETLQGASGVVLVCDTTNAASLSPLKAVAKLLPAHMPCVAVGTKSDEVSKRKITQEDIKRELVDTSVLEVSAKTGACVEMLFVKLAIELVAAAEGNQNGWVAALAAKTGKPYRWAQYFGLNCTALSPTVHRRHVTRTMQLIEQRAITRDALAKQLLALKDKELLLSTLDQEAIQGRFQLKATATLAHWRLQDKQPDPYTRHYTAEFTRADLRLHADVSISVEYPIRPPQFFLRLAGAQAEADPELRVLMQTMETEVNLFYNELVFGGKSRDYLLSLQLRKLQMMFDMYVQSLQSLDSKGVMIGKLFERNRRGRDRCVPTQYKAAARLFTHRVTPG